MGVNVNVAVAYARMLLSFLKVASRRHSVLHLKANNLTAIKQVSVALALLFASCAAAQTQSQFQSVNVSASIDTSKTGHPISKYIYGQFLEHGGNLVNEGVSAEMLTDRSCWHGGKETH